MVKIDLSVWGGGGPVKGRYTDVAFYYRLVGSSTYTLLQSNPVPMVYTGDQAKFNGMYEEYTFAIPPYPANTSGSIEYYYEMKLDGVQNHANGIKTIRVIPVGATNAWNNYNNSTVGISFNYPVNWTSELNTDNSITEGNTPPKNATSTFSMDLLPPNWGTDPSGVAIQISAFYLNNSDNKPISTQLTAICAYYQIKNCTPSKNKNDVEFIQNTYDEGIYGNEILDLVPTGKNILGFDLQNGGSEAQTLSQIIDTITLQ